MLQKVNIVSAINILYTVGSFFLLHIDTCCSWFECYKLVWIWRHIHQAVVILKTSWMWSGHSGMTSCECVWDELTAKCMNDNESEMESREWDSVPIGTFGCLKKKNEPCISRCVPRLYWVQPMQSEAENQHFLSSCLLFYEWAMGNVCVCSPPSSCMGHCVWVMICLACHRWINMAKSLRGGLHIYRVDLTRVLPFLF